MLSYAMQRLPGQANQMAAIVADPTLEMGMLLKEILRSLSIQPAVISPDPRDAMRAVDSFQADLIVVDDTVATHAGYVLRSFMTSPICNLTPTVVLLSEASKSDGAWIASINRPMIVNKPLSPGRFATGFKALNKVWSQGFFKEIIEALKRFHEGRTDEGMQILIQLTRNPRAQPVVAPAISAILRSSGNVRVAEKILLAALKVAPRDSGVVLALSDLYIRNAMPFTALRLIKSFESGQSSNIITTMDAVQAHLMLNDIDSAINRMTTLVAQDLAGPNGRDLLARMYYTDGRLEEFTRTINNESRANKLAAAWNGTTPPVDTNKALQIATAS